VGAPLSRGYRTWPVGSSSPLVETPPLSGLSALTLEARVRAELLGAPARGAPTQWAANTFLFLWVQSDGTLQALVMTAGGQLTATTTVVLAAGREYHVAMTYDGTTLRVFVDGVQNGNQPTGNALVTNAGSIPLLIGGYSNGALNWRGTIRDVRVWSRALTAAELGAYVPRLSGRELGLVGWWPLDGDTLDRKVPLLRNRHHRDLGLGELDGYADDQFAWQGWANNSNSRQLGYYRRNGRSIEQVGGQYQHGRAIAVVPEADGIFEWVAHVTPDLVLRYIDANNNILANGGAFQSVAAGAVTGHTSNFAGIGTGPWRVRAELDGATVRVFYNGVLWYSTTAATHRRAGGFGPALVETTGLYPLRLASDFSYTPWPGGRPLHGVAKNGARPALARAVA
jgi:hypothetical protein